MAANLCLACGLAELFWSLFCLAFPLASPAFRYMADREEACQALQQTETAPSSASRVLMRAAQAAAGERPVRVALGPEHYPTRDYGTFALPAGVYTSLRVTLGAGAGHNWWCVIFPPLCAQAAGLSEQAVQALSDDDVRLVTESDGGYVVRFRLLELWDALVQRLS